MPIKQLFLAGRLVVGVGNIYASEVLFLSGIRPMTAASRIGAARVRKLHQAIRSVPLRAEMGEHCATFRMPMEWRATDVASRAAAMSAPATAVAAIELIRQGQRSTYFCRQCQRP